MSGQRVVRPAELPRQRGTRTSAPGGCRGGPSDPSRKRAGQPAAPCAPRTARRAPSRYSPVAESLTGFLLCVLVIGLTAAAIAVVGAAFLGLA